MINRQGVDGRMPDCKIVTIGMEPDLVERLYDRLSLPQSVSFEHLLHPLIVRYKLGKDFGKRHDVHLFRNSVRDALPETDIAALKTIETEGVPTIREMIMSDRVACHLPADDVLSYMTMLQRRITEVLEQVNPVFVVGNYDSLHEGIACGVARTMGIPFIAVHFTSLPSGLVRANIGLIPDSALPIQYYDDDELRQLAIDTMKRFEARMLMAPAYESPVGGKELLRKLPDHLGVLMRTILAGASGNRCRFSMETVYTLMSMYMKRRYNRLRLHPARLLASVPDSPFVFYGFHMQPESTIDVWGSFFSDQFNVIENIVRSTPIDHLVLLKIHRSDIDSYSPAQFARIEGLPRVKIISPFVSSYDFIARAAAVFTIQGTIGLEAALLGRPVIVFGKNRLTLFPSVCQVNRLDEMPALLRAQLSQKPPDRSSIVAAYQEYLRPYIKACRNEWHKEITPDALKGLSALFSAIIENFWQAEQISKKVQDYLKMNTVDNQA
ncbi:MAG: hypothetical protein HGB36_10595 [Chlorobiaceae bacterium]|nr:hypothetical protein [Chlorobiaceae bacterium]